MTSEKEALAVKRRARRGRLLEKLLIYGILILVAILCAGPFCWMFSTSFKTGENIYEFSFIPKHPTLNNYTGVMEFMGLGKYLINTAIMTVAGIAMDVVFSSMCAYPLAKFDFYGKKFITGLLMMLQILPHTAGLIVNYLTIGKMHLMGTYLSAILPSGVAIFSIILFRQAYYAVPNELLEAARIDGASEFKIWYQVMLPQIKPSVTTIIIFDFVFKWNNFLWPLIVLNPDKYPIAAALNYLNGTFTFNFGYIAAATIISILPILVVFVMFQKNYINAVAGAVKG